MPYITLKDKYPDIRVDEFRSVYYSGTEKSTGLTISGAFHGVLKSFADDSLKIAVVETGQYKIYKVRMSAVIDII